MSTKVVTGQFRASFAHVFEAYSNNGGEPKFSITMLIPKSDTATYNAIQAAMQEAAQLGLTSQFGGKMPAVLKNPLYDGDGVRPNGETFGEECHGHWVITGSSKQRPGVVDENVQPILNPTEFYSGCYARASLNFFAYNSNGNRGIGCGLNNVQKLADGEPFSGRSSAEDDFGGASTNSGFTPVGNAPTPFSGPAPTTPAQTITGYNPITGQPIYG